jgi:hypothetical protein
MPSGLCDDDKMTRFNLAKDERLFIETLNTEDFNSRLPEIFDALVECTSFLNNRYIERNELAKIAFVFL